MGPGKERDEPAEPLNPDMNARRLSHSAGYSLESATINASVLILDRTGPKTLTLVLARHDIRVDIVVRHELSQGDKPLRRVDGLCTYCAHG